MTKDKLLICFKNWYDQHAITPLLNGNKVEAYLLCVKEIYIDENVGINRSYYQYTLDANLTRDGLPKAMIYSSIDLLGIAPNGDVISIRPIDYDIV